MVIFILAESSFFLKMQFFMIYGLYTLCIQTFQPSDTTSEISSTAIIWRRRMQGRKSRLRRVFFEKSTKERGDNLRQTKLVCLGAAFL